MKAIALIPARKGSKRIPNKNMVKVGGHPLIWHSIVTALSCDLIQEPVYVSTDSPLIAAFAEDSGCEIIQRPAKLAQDDSTDYDVIFHFLKTIAPFEGLPDLLVYLRPTSPLRSLGIVSAAISMMSAIVEQTEDRHEPTSLRSIEEMSESAWKCFELEGKVMLKGLAGITIDRAGDPNQTFPKTYRPNGYIDIVRPELVIKNKQAWGNRAYGYITPRITELDEPEDLERLNFDLATKKGSDVSFASGKIEHGKDIYLDPMHKVRR